MRLTTNYISLPRKLIVELRDNPLAIALYFLIARLYIIQHRPVALSRGDLRKIDPTLREGAIKRAFDRLLRSGWLIATAGHKKSYTPCWGVHRTGTPYEWRVGEARLGCPTHITNIRVDRHVLDIFIGKISPHSYNTFVERYFTQPLLQLYDIGQYILVATDITVAPEATERLQIWGLITDGQAQIPAEVTTIISIASQRTSIDGFQLTQAAWRKLGCFAPATSPPPDARTPTTHALFFVPPHQIGDLIPHQIGDLIGKSPTAKAAFERSTTGQTEPVTTSQNLPRTQRKTNKTRYSPPAPQLVDGAPLQRRESGTTSTLTEAAKLLIAYGIQSSACIAELGILPIKQVGGAIAYAQEQNLGPGMVVQMLRNWRDHGMDIPRTNISSTSALDVDAVLHGPYGDLFKRGPSMPQGAGHHTPLQVSSVSVSSIRRTRASTDACDATQTLRAQLQGQCDRKHWPLIRRLQVQVMNQTTIIRCGSPADHRQVLSTWVGTIRLAAEQIGLPGTIRVTATDSFTG